MAQLPLYVRTFRDALLAVRIDRLSLPGTKPEIEGRRGVLTTSRLQYNDKPWQLLKRSHEYTFWLPPNNPLEVSLRRLVHALRSCGFDVDDSNQLTLGTFNAKEGTFIDTTDACSVGWARSLRAQAIPFDSKLIHV